MVIKVDPPPPPMESQNDNPEGGIMNGLMITFCIAIVAALIVAMVFYG